MNLAEWPRHAFLNRLQALVLIGFMAGFLALLGHLIAGPPAQAWLPGSHPVRPHGMPAVASLPARPRYHVSGLWY
jgi:hypothetical protein